MRKPEAISSKFVQEKAYLMGKLSTDIANVNPRQVRGFQHLNMIY